MVTIYLALVYIVHPSSKLLQLKKMLNQLTALKLKIFNLLNQQHNKN